MLKENAVVVVAVVPTPKLNPPTVVVARGKPVVAAVVVPVFEASNASPGVAAVDAALLARLKLGAVATVDVNVVVVVVLPRLNPVPVAIGFGVPNVKPVDPYKHAYASIPVSINKNSKIMKKK